MSKRSFAIIGLNTFGQKIVEVLCGKGAHIIAVDQDEEIIDKFKDIAGITTAAVDATDEGVLKRLGMENVDVAVVAMGTNVASSILVTTSLKTLGVKEIIARARSHEQVRALKRVGANRVVFPEEDVAERLAHSILSPGVREHIDIAAGLDIAEVEAPSKMLGKTLGELRLNEKFGIVVMAIVRKTIQNGQEEEGMAKERGEAEVANSSYVLKKNDIIIAVGKEGNIEKFEGKLGEYK